MNSKQIEQLYREEKAKMLSYVRSHMDERTRDAEDLVQDVMLKMFRLLTLNTKIENLAAYAWTSLKNLIVDMQRARSIRKNDHLEDHHDTLASDAGLPEEEMLREHFTDYMKQAMQQLKPSEKAIWLATEIEELSYQELSEMWDEPVGTLLSRKFRAEKKILNTLNNVYKETKQ